MEGDITEARKRKRRKIRVSDVVLYLIIVVVMLLGIGLLAYPSVSNWWNQMHQSQVVAGYVGEISAMSSQEREEIRRQVRRFNASVSDTTGTFKWTEQQSAQYPEILNISGTGIMGYLDIPSINVHLPVYHNTSDEVLQTAVGHLEGTSLPVGGPSTHVVLSGHSGLPSAKLFTDLDTLVEGNIFQITVLDEVLTYQVCQIDVVLPHEMDLLEVVPGEDLVTLITCTPYGVNSHRLLVRGTRIPTPEEGEILEEPAPSQKSYMPEFLDKIAELWFVPAIAVAILLLLLTKKMIRH